MILQILQVAWAATLRRMDGVPLDGTQIAHCLPGSNDMASSERSTPRPQTPPLKQLLPLNPTIWPASQIHFDVAISAMSDSWCSFPRDFAARFQLQLYAGGEGVSLFW